MDIKILLIFVCFEGRGKGGRLDPEYCLLKTKYEHYFFYATIANREIWKAKHVKNYKSCNQTPVKKLLKCSI